MKKGFLSVLLALVMILSMVSPAMAANEVTEVDLENGTYTISQSGTYTVKSYNGSNSLVINANGNTSVTLDGVSITAYEGVSAISIVQGNVTLNIANDSTLTGGKDGAGIYVASGASVTITGTGGKLTAIGNNGADNNGSGAAGIGGTHSNGDSGSITIDGATVVAKGHGVHGSGIGSGSGKVVGEIKIINGANVTAYGGYYAECVNNVKSDYEGGAAIGGGGKTGSTIAAITITDSNVTAYGGSKAAGIGVTFWSSVKNITISGNSTVTAQGGSYSAGIGTSREGGNGVTANIVISGGTVNATGGYYGAGIGRGYNNKSLGNGLSETALPKVNITISGGTITATGGEGGAGIGGGYKGENIDIGITGGKITASAGPLVSGKTVESGGAPSAIGTGANGSGTFVNSPDVEIANEATISISSHYGGKPAIEGIDRNEDLAKLGNVSFNYDYGTGEEEPNLPVKNNTIEWDYPSLQDAVDAAEDGDTIIVTSDHALEWNTKTKVDDTYAVYVCVATDKSVTIDLNGKHLTGDSNQMSETLYAAFAVDNGGELTLIDSSSNGEGAVNVSGTAFSLFMASEDAKGLTISGGNYCLGTASNSLLYSGGSELITVNGGTFNADAFHKDHIFEVKNNPTKASVNNGNGTWTIVDSVASVNKQYQKNSDWYTKDTGYTTLQEAINAIEETESTTPESVTLTKSITLENRIEISTTVALSLNSHTITGSLVLAPPNDAAIESVRLTVADGQDLDVISDMNGYVAVYENEAWSLTPGYIVTLNTNGGTINSGNITSYICSTGAILPTDVTRTGYTFNGWYDNEEYAGTAITSISANETGDKSFYAKWTQIVHSSGSSSSPKYSVTTKTIENGSVKTSPSYAKFGNTVTLTVLPNKGFALDALTVLDTNGNLIVTTKQADDTYTFEMPRGKVTIEATFTKLVTANTFTDVAKNSYYYEAVNWAVERGITAGTSNTTFSPNASCTRAQMMTFLWRAAGSPEPRNTSYTFTDVTADSYYNKAVLWAIENGITSGTGNNKFSPDAECNRAQMATFLYRITKGQTKSSESTFTDVDPGAYYAEAVQWAVENGITSGTGNGKYSPNATCTRSQMVTFLYRCFAE